MVPFVIGRNAYEDDSPVELADEIAEAIRMQSMGRGAAGNCHRHGDKNIVMCQCLLRAIEGRLRRMNNPLMLDDVTSAPPPLRVEQG